MTRRESFAMVAAAAAPGIEKYVRFQIGPRQSWGKVEGDAVVPLSAAPYLNGRPLGGKKLL